MDCAGRAVKYEGKESTNEGTCHFPGVEAIYTALQSPRNLLKSSLVNFPAFGNDHLTGLGGVQLFEDLRGLLFRFFQAIVYEDNRQESKLR